MKKIFKALNFTVVILFLLVSFIACDKDFSTVESDVLGEDNINFNTVKVNLPIIAYNKKLDSLQINNLSSNLFGVFNDPNYGQTTASIITQVSPSGFNPNFGDNTVLDSVVLNIPYFSRAITDSTYTISDSLYGNAPFHLSIFRNNYFLRDFNPNSQTNERQNYFSKANGSINDTDNFAITENTTINFDTNKGELLFEDPNFIPSNETIYLTPADSTAPKTKLAPALRVKLDSLYWVNSIIEKEGQPELSNENNFKNYFRGLYIKAQAIGEEGSLVFLNLASTDAKITIYFSKDSAIDGERTQDSYNLNLASTSSININRLNTFINDHSLVTLTNGNKTLGDEKLYLKGMEGSMAVVDLFSGMVECENEDGTTSLVPALDCFKKTYRVPDGNGGYKKDNFGNYILKQLINEARLIIHEDDEGMLGPDDYHKYDRIYAYDVKNNLPTIDYLFDPTTNNSIPLSSKIMSLGQRDPDQLKYKIRLTEHLNSILIRDSTNTKIGLVLSSNVNADYNASNFFFNKSIILNSNDDVKGVPATSIITPRGTILHGTNANVPENKRMVLEIFFTKPK